MISGVLEAGCDEAGRGPLAGSVFAAAVILPPSLGHSLPLEGEPEGAVLNDSKQLTDHQRRALRPIIEREALAWAVAEVTPEEIDRLNILNASILAMQRALDQILRSPFFKDHPQWTLQHIIVDGNRWKPYVPDGEIMAIPADTVIKGDATYMSIAATSILAKTYRDDYMLRLHEQYPQYGWDENKGYPTPQHYAALRQFGPSPFHRQSFNMHLSTQNSSNEGSSFNSSPKVGEVAALLTEEYVKNK